MGIGHLMRCLTLAEAFHSRGADVSFVCREHVGHMIDFLRAHDIRVVTLPAPSRRAPDRGGVYGAWLGVPQEEDVQQTLEALHGASPDWVIVDHYGLDAAWEDRVRSCANKVMVIDDLANRPHACDVLLDANYAPAGMERYRDLVPRGSRLLLGPRYALLRAEYLRSRSTQRVRDGQVRRVLVFFGGSDPGDMTGTALAALSLPEFRDLYVDVVIGANNGHRAALEQAISQRGQAQAHGLRPHLADLMAQADLAIGAGGTTTWERMCMGLPSVIVSIAENQEAGCEALRSAGLVRYLGRQEDVGVREIADALRQCLETSDLLVDTSERNKMIVDGLGTSRVVEHLDPTPSAMLRVRPARIEDMLLYLQWANDPEVRRQAVNTDRITLESHREWFKTKMSTPSSHMFVMLAGSLPVGQVRFDRIGREAVIDYSIDASFRGRGWAKDLLALGMQRVLEKGPAIFRADVKEANRPSQAVFLRLGFTESRAQEGFRTYLFDSTKRADEFGPTCE